MNVINILNTIRDNASSAYKDFIPVATQKNILDIQGQMTDNSKAMLVNEFMNTLLNMVIRQEIITKNYTNKLKSLKKGTKPLGDTIEEIYANYVQSKGFDASGKDLLEREIPDIKAAYHKMNRKDKYKLTISPEMISKAFSDYTKLETFISNIINSLYKSSERDEFILMKELFKQAIEKNALKVVEVSDPILGEKEAKEFIKTVKIVSGDMEYANSNNNNWLEVQKKDKKPLITNSSKSEQVLIISNPTDVSVSLDVLANTFNMTVAEFNDTRKIVIDAFPLKNMRAVLVDEQFFQVFDDLVMFKKFENVEGLYDNYILHIWQTLSFSPLVNAVAFCVPDENSEENTEKT